LPMFMLPPEPPTFLKENVRFTMFVSNHFRLQPINI
jgi:hypothetical protein